MSEDVCPYVFCPKCKSSDSWVRYKAKDVLGRENGEILWKSWRCKYCGDVALEPTMLVKKGVESGIT